jgi:uncharacterized protein (PEP-CTERM system associated)
MASNRWLAREHNFRLAAGTAWSMRSRRGAVRKMLVFCSLSFTSIAFAANPYGTVSGAEEAAAERQPSWHFVPRVSLRETYTDNVTLTRSNNAQSEFVTEISPGFALRNQGARSKIDIDYSLTDFFYWRDRDRNTLSHQLRGSGEFEFIEDLFFLDSRASISQQAVSAFGPIGANSSVNNNNQTFRSYSISPYLRKHFGREATGEARFTHSQLSSNASSGSTSDSASDRILLKLNSGPAFNDWGWGAEFSRENIDYQRSTDTTYQSITGNGRYRISPTLFATGSLGYDKNDYFTTGEKPEGAFWTIGADWRPQQRTTLNISAGRRYFGNTYSLTFQHSSRRTTWDVSYQQNLSTSRSQFSQPAGLSLRQNEAVRLVRTNPGISTAELLSKLDAFAEEQRSQGLDPDSELGTNFQTNTAFVEKKWQGLLTMDFTKSELRFRAFNSVRDSSSVVGSQSILSRTGDFALSQVIKQSGIGSTWTYHLSARNDANVGLDLSRYRLVDIGRVDNLTSLNLGLARKLSRTANGTVTYRHIRRDSNFNPNDYDENAFVGTLTLTF